MKEMGFQTCSEDYANINGMSGLDLHVQEGHDHDRQNIPYSFFHKLSPII